MAKEPFILASSSPRRLSLLKDIGIVPDMIAHADIDETPLPRETPRQQAQRLAYEKLKAVVENASCGKDSEVPPSLRGRLGGGYVKDDPLPAIILAADTVVGCGRRILPKAETDDDVRRCWHLMSGRRHHVYTAVAMRTPQGKVLQRVADSVVAFNRVSVDGIEAYVKSGEGIGKAGGYAIQGRAAAHIRFISGSYSNIVGLPLFDVAQMLGACGYQP